MLPNVVRAIRLHKAATMSMSHSAPLTPTRIAVLLTIRMMEMMRITTANPCSIVESKGWAVFLSILTHLETYPEASPIRVSMAAIAVKHQASVHLKDFLLWVASLPLVLASVT
jgi:hypothetical protein